MKYKPDYQSNAVIQQYLQKQLKNGTVAHTNIWVNSDFPNPGSLFENFVFRWLCSNPSASGEACLRCRVCQMLTNDSHPNITIVSTDTAHTTISAIRELISEAPKTGFLPGPRLMVIGSADTLTREASNALLKVLEEPQRNLYWFLMTTDVSTLPATVVSRSAIIWFQPTIPSPTAQQKLLDTAQALQPILREVSVVKRLEILDAVVSKQITSQQAIDLLTTITLLLRDELLRKMNLPELISFPAVVATQNTRRSHATLLNQLTTLDKAITTLRSTNTQPRLILENTILHLIHS